MSEQIHEDVQPREDLRGAPGGECGGVGQPVTCNALLVAALAGATTHRERAAAARLPDIVTAAAMLKSGSDALKSLLDLLRAASVPTRAWLAEVKTRRTALADARREAERRERAASGDARPDVLIRTDREHQTNDDAAEALASIDDLYSRAFALVRPLQDEETGAPSIRTLPITIVRDVMTRAARFVVEKKDKETGELYISPAHPPAWCVQAIHDRGEWPVRPLRGIVETPVLRFNGTVLEVPGYDVATGLLYDPTEAYLPLPEFPSEDDRAEALRDLFDVVKDFPFAEDADRAAWLASLLTPFVRHAYEGPAPLFGITANVRGSGKGLLCEVTMEIAFGRPPHLMVHASERDAAAEDRKRITSLVLRSSASRATLRAIRGAIRARIEGITSAGFR